MNGCRRSSSSSSDDDTPLLQLHQKTTTLQEIRRSSLKKKEHSPPHSLHRRLLNDEHDTVAGTGHARSSLESKSTKSTTWAGQKRAMISPAVMDDSSEDERPLSLLNKQKSVIKKEHKDWKKEKSPSSKKSKKKHSSSTSSKKSSSPVQSAVVRKTKAPVAPTSFKQQECSEALYASKKGKIVQALLCRWWYAIEWPDGVDGNVPENSQALDGFDGTYIIVKGDEMGTIIDQRKAIGKPTFINLFAKPTSLLVELLQKAYEKQIQVLKDYEGTDAPMLKDLEAQRRRISTVSTERADKEAKKILKVWKPFAPDLARLAS